MVYGTYNNSYWAYKPTYSWGASHCMYIGIFPLDYMGLYELYIHTWIIYIYILDYMGDEITGVLQGYEITRFFEAEHYQMKVHRRLTADVFGRFAPLLLKDWFHMHPAVT